MTRRLTAATAIRQRREYPCRMADLEPNEPKQTTPTGKEIPIPTRDAFLRDLAKAAPKSERPPAKPENRD